MNLLDASCRVALAAFLHDLGKFAERAKIESSQDAVETHKLLYCPTYEVNGVKRTTHTHAAYTALAFDIIECNAPDIIKGDMAPFASRANGQEITDSLVNAAAMHHRPDTFLQWIIATADRVASGFEREEFESYNKSEDQTDTGRNHYQARQITLFEQIFFDGKKENLQWRYPLQPLSPESIFPVKREGYEPDNNQQGQKEYAALWLSFLQSLERIPVTHRLQWPLWIDHFDTLWQTYTHAIPAATAFGIKPDVSLYDHSKTAAALATALWRWHHDFGATDSEAAISLKHRQDWDEKKFLMVQGDFFGIQNFIFADGSQTNKNAAKLLRGRSFQVSLFTEMAALRVLEACDLPPTSQITNAAGKFLIVAPNTVAVKRKLELVRDQINEWFLTQGFGLAGIGLVGEPACCNDFMPDRFNLLLQRLFEQLENAKLRRFALTERTSCVLDADYARFGACQYNAAFPADKQDDERRGSAKISRDQIKLGSELAHMDRLLVLRDVSDLRKEGIALLELPIFGYQIAFTAEENASGKFGLHAKNANLLRCWDFNVPTSLQGTVWHGYARRYINAYVPRFNEQDDWSSAKYSALDAELLDDLRHGAIKTLSHISCEDKSYSEADGKWIGQNALMTLKGDVDNLGAIFQTGLDRPSFAKMAALSRHINAFFSLWLPAYCATYAKNTYTVFAGGDDFFLIGPWHASQQLASDMAENFKKYVAENPHIHFSAGMVMHKPGLPINSMARSAEDALAEAKRYQDPDNPNKRKNALRLFNETVCWKNWTQVKEAEKTLEQLRDDYKLSTGFVYGMLHLLDVAEDTSRPESSMWRSKLYYRSARWVESQRHRFDSPEKRRAAIHKLVDILGEQGIVKLKGCYRIPLFNQFYRQR